MTVSKFPLLKLPFLPLEDVAKQMNFVSLLQLSMVFRKSKNILKMLRLKVPIQSMGISFGENAYYISICQNDDDISFIDVGRNQAGERALAFLERPWSGLAVLEGQVSQVNKITVPSESSRSLETLEKVVKHILSMSKVEKLSLSLGNRIKDIRNLFIFRITKQFYELKVRSLYLSSEDLTFLLENVSVYRLNLNVDWSCLGFKYRKPIKHPVFTISKSDWLDLETLKLSPDTISAHFDNFKVNNRVLDRLIKDWKEGKNLKLKEVLFKWKDTHPLIHWQDHPGHPERFAVANESVAPLNGKRIVVANRQEIGPSYSILYTTRLSVSDQIGRDQPWIAIVE